MKYTIHKQMFGDVEIKILVPKHDQIKKTKLLKIQELTSYLGGKEVDKI